MGREEGREKGREGGERGREGEGRGRGRGGERGGRGRDPQEKFDKSSTACTMDICPSGNPPLCCICSY